MVLGISSKERTECGDNRLVTEPLVVERAPP